MTDAELIAQLEAVVDPGPLSSCATMRNLDAEIALALGWKRVGKGWAHWTNPDGETNRHIPFYTTSLDDKLPGENIERVVCLHFETHSDVWEALNIDPKTGRRTAGAGHTEALARRVAALKAISAANMKTRSA